MPLPAQPWVRPCHPHPVTVVPPRSPAPSILHRKSRLAFMNIFLFPMPFPLKTRWSLQPLSHQAPDPPWETVLPQPPLPCASPLLTFPGCPLETWARLTPQPTSDGAREAGQLLKRPRPAAQASSLFFLLSHCGAFASPPANYDLTPFTAVRFRERKPTAWCVWRGAGASVREVRVL